MPLGSIGGLGDLENQLSSADDPLVVGSGNPRLVSATEDGNGMAVLTFQWPAIAPSSGLGLASYSATLWSDSARTTAISGGATQTVTTRSAMFGGLPRGIPFLLDVTAVDTSGSAGPTISLIQVSPGGVLPGQPLDAPSTGAGGGEGGDDADGILAPLRPVYGTVDGVKRWSRVITFGNAPGQVSALDVLYFLMVASDDADGEFSQRYAVPLTKYRDSATGLFRYPPPIPGLIERKAAGLLLYSRKAALTEQQSGTAVGMMTYADKRITDIAANDYMIGQTLMGGALPKVYCPVPRQFSMAGDPEGLKFNTVVGSTDVRFQRPHGLAYVGVGWRGGSGQIDDIVV